MRKLTTEEFITKAKEVHGELYNYSKVVYLGNKNKVTIICHIHGEFEQSPSKHLIGRGCSNCGGTIKSTKEQFIEKANNVHNFKYEYNKLNYLSSKKQVIITCPIHGDFEQTPSDHLQGCGCYKCSLILRAVKRSTGTEQFILKAKQIHGDIYDYTKVNYVNTETKVKLLCAIHGIWEQKPGNHLQGNWCPGCANYGFDKTKPAYLYYLKVTTDDGQILYKIGITNRTVEERFQLNDLNKIEIVKQKLYDNGQDALDLETKLKQLYRAYQYKGPPVLSSGNTELFTEDIITVHYNGCVHIDEN